MADYRELLRRAVDALPENNGTSRRAVYEKAREALVTQLRAIDPPLPAREITQHRLTLEDCIRQVEQEATEALLQGLKRDTEAPIKPLVEPKTQATTAPAEGIKTQPEVEVEDAAVEVNERPEPVASMVEPEDADGEQSEEPQDEIEIESDDAELVIQENPVEQNQDVDAKETVLKAAAEDEVVVDEAVEPQPEPAETVEDEAEAVELEVEADEEKDDSEHDKQEAIVQLNHEKAADSKDVAPAVKAAATSEPVKDKLSTNPVDEVIAAAQAASSAAAIQSPSVDLKPAVGQGSSVAPSISPALSSVREVEADEVLPESSAISVGGDEPQATIDRAIKALDLEAEGKDATSFVGEGKDPTNKGTSAPSESEASAGKLLDDLSGTQIVEDEETGGNGLTVFLLLVVLLLVGAGGGAFWAWKEGYVDLNPLMAQLGLAEKLTTTTASAPTTETPRLSNTNENVAVQSNVRDVTPTATTPVLTETAQPAEPEVQETTSETVASPEGEVRLAPENAPAEPAAETEVATETDVAPTEEVPAAPTDERLVAEGASAETDQPTLNVGDTSESIAEVGSRSLLIEEQITGTGGAVPFTGETIWSRDVDELGSPVIKASVSVPARNLAVNVLFRKNSDPALPASHLVEVNFAVTESFLGGGVASLPGILLKDQELAQGDPLIGASARIFDNSFLFALSAAEGDLAKNIDLISARGWIDLPVVYSTGRKAIVTMEKGKDGRAIFEAVLAAWTAE